ncbi:MAG: hypothetical protein H7070_14035 [Saprospiraceae bacterium]|nr:hypothetical protein [Pyrinomonadaceae bacterium]
MNILLAVNAGNARRRSLNFTRSEELEARIMARPISLEASFAYFGLMLGSLPPAAIIFALILNSSVIYPNGVWLVGLMFAANILTAIVGYFSGKLVADCVRQIREFPVWSQFALVPLIGLSWGMISGGIGGALILLYGGFVGAIMGGAVGLAALPVFTLIHSHLSQAEMIETKHFLPIASGITLSICAFILGL